MSKKADGSPTEFALIAPETIQAIKDTRKRKGNIFLFAARRGLAPVVSCIDCGYIFRSAESGAPYSLIRTKKDGAEERWFVCTASGERVRAADTCAQCGSWRLRERGIGIQQVYDELHKLFPNTPIILFDHITARTYKKALFLRDTFYKTRGAILLGTQMAIPYLTQPVMLSTIVNMDALLATPTWRVEEENLALLLTLRERTLEKLIIQTRSPETEALSCAKQGLVEQFYTQELELRKAFNYPPYATFIHCTWQGTPEQVRAIEQDIQTLLADFGVTTYPNPTAPAQSPIAYALVRVPSSTWPNPALVEQLRKIHPSVRIVINPDRIV
jgi:primosomal protein N' (replication factor Y)